MCSLDGNNMPAHPVLFAIKSLSHFDCDHFKNTFCASTHYAANMKLGAQKQDDGKESVTTLGEHGARSIAEVMAGDEKGLRVEAGTETSAGIAELDMLHNPVAAALVLGTSNMRRMHSALTMACESLPPNMAAETTAHVTGQTEKGAHYVTKTHFDTEGNVVFMLHGRKDFYVTNPDQIDKPKIGNSQHGPEFAPDVHKFDFVARLGPGNVLYVPPGWWHHVRSIEETVMVSAFVVSKK
jgi:hypothetical protein